MKTLHARDVLFPLASLLVADLLIFLMPMMAIGAVAQSIGQSIGALLLLVLVPGWALARLLLGRTHSADDRLLLLLTGLSAGFGVVSLTLLLLAYLPGGVTRALLLSTFHLITLAAVVALWLAQDRVDTPLSAPGAAPVAAPGAAPVAAPGAAPGAAPAGEDRASLLPGRFWAVLCALVVLAGVLRFAWLGYSEFQGDEARVLLRAQELLAGFENAVFIHQKTPGEILISAGVLGVSDAASEAAARLPFAVAGVAAVAALLLLGWRLLGAVAGTVAAALLAVDGYAVGFARIVQYQSVVILASVLMVLLLWRMVDAARAGQRPPRLARQSLLVAAMALGGLYAHYDVLAIGLPVLWLLGNLGLRIGWGRLLRGLLPALLVLGAGAALLFVPWMRHPGFGMALDYVVGERLGSGELARLPYDNLYDVARRTSAYSSTYYVLVLLAMTMFGALTLFARRFGRQWAGAGALVVGGALALAALMGRGAGLLYGGVVVAVLLLLVGLLPRLSVEERTIWLWFAPLMVLTLFLVRLPDTHVYTFFVPWFLVVGATAQQMYMWSQGITPGQAVARLLMPVAGVLLLALFWNWQWQLFADAPAERYRQWATARPALYWYPFDAPPERANMGFPLRNGWKSIGVLYADGALAGGFESNAKPEVVDWYTRGAGACPELPVRTLLAETVESFDDGQLAERRDNLAAASVEEGSVSVRGVTRLRSFAGGALPAWRVADEDAEAPFARLAVQPPLNRRGRILTLPEHTPLDVQVGDAFRLRGYSGDLANAAPGATLTLTLYWESVAIIPESYTVFLQLIDPATNRKAAQTDALPVCGQNLTNQWRAGDLIADPQRLELFADAAPGEYTLYAGMYDLNTGMRLAISDASGTRGDWVALAQVVVKKLVAGKVLFKCVPTVVAPVAGELGQLSAASAARRVASMHGRSCDNYRTHFAVRGKNPCNSEDWVVQG